MDIENNCFIKEYMCILIERVWRCRWMYVNMINNFALYIDSYIPQRSGVLIHSVTLSDLQIIKDIEEETQFC